jgi:hypothetical protein
MLEIINSYSQMGKSGKVTRRASSCKESLHLQRQGAEHGLLFNYGLILEHQELLGFHLKSQLDTGTLLE